MVGVAFGIWWSWDGGGGLHLERIGEDPNGVVLPATPAALTDGLETCMARGPSAE
jgi:hypothetical protein